MAKKTTDKQTTALETTTALKITQALSPLPGSKADELRKIFVPMIKMLDEFEAAVAEVKLLPQSPQKCDKAKRLRLDIGRIRIEAEKKRKELKEGIVIAGKAIDGVNNILKYAVKDREDELREIEEYYERLEAERLARLAQQRADKLEPYLLDDQTIEEYTGLGALSDQEFETLLKDQKETMKIYKAEQKRLREEEKAQKAEQARIRRENEELKAAQAAQAEKLTALQQEKDRLAEKVKATTAEKARQTRAKNLALKSEEDVSPYAVLQRWLARHEDVMPQHVYEDFCDTVLLLAEDWRHKDEV